MDVYQYLENNCTDMATAALQPNITFTYMDGSPYADMLTWAYGWTGM